MPSMQPVQLFLPIFVTHERDLSKFKFKFAKLLHNCIDLYFSTGVRKGENR